MSSILGWHETAFSEARTYRDWLPKEVSDQNLNKIYEL